MVLYSKACKKCDSAEKKGEEAEEHECSKNFEGSSKSMESYSTRHEIGRASCLVEYAATQLDTRSEERRV